MGEEEQRAVWRNDPRRRRLDRLDRLAEAEGYERDGAFRPWYRKHLRELAARTGDAEIIALLDRLDEIAAAEREKIELVEALREWEATAVLIDRVRVA